MPVKNPINNRYRGPNPRQIRLLQTAAGAVGLRQSGQYYLLLAQYLAPDGKPVTSCKQLTNAQIDNFLAICESLGFRHPGKPENFYRNKDARRYEEASFAQQAAIRHLAAELGWKASWSTSTHPPTAPCSLTARRVTWRSKIRSFQATASPSSSG